MIFKLSTQSIFGLKIVILLFLCKSNTVLAQHPLSCTFLPNPPTTSLYSCGSEVQAKVTKQNLPISYTSIEVYYPLQFDLILIDSVTVVENSYIDGALIQTILVSDPSISNLPSVSVPLKKVIIPFSEIPSQTNEFILTFSVNTCEINYSNVELEDIISHPMYFDMNIIGNGVDPINAYFNQQLMQFGSSGLIKFTSLINNSASLTNVGPEPLSGTYNFINPFTRKFNLLIHGNSFSSITISIDQETDIYCPDFAILDANGLPHIISYTVSGSGIHQYTISHEDLVNTYNFTSLSPGTNTFTFTNLCSKECNQAQPLTRINATISCNDCSDPINSNELVYNALTPTVLNYTASHTVSTASSSCFSNIDYNVTFAFPSQNYQLPVNEISFPFVTDNLTISSIIVTSPGQSDLIITSYSTPNNTRIVIAPENQNGSWPNLIYNDSQSKYLTQLNSPTAYGFTIHVIFQYNDEFNNCDGNSPHGLSTNLVNQNYSRIVFGTGCLAEVNLSTNKDVNLGTLIKFPNLSSTLTGGCSIPDLIPNLTNIPFEYSLYISSILNPLSLYGFTNTSSPNQLTNFCNQDQLKYQLVITNELSLVSNPNLFSFLSSATIEANVNGSTIVGVIDGSNLTFDIPASLITTLNTIQFSIQIGECPFTVNPYNGIAKFSAKFLVFCENCPAYKVTLDCVGVDDSEVDQLLMHCPGTCTSPSGGAGTESFKTERASFGWINKDQYQVYQSSPNINSLIKDASSLRHTICSSVFPNANYDNLSNDQNSELDIILQEELKKLYPYDIILVHAVGSFKYSPYVSGLQFEIAHDHNTGASGNEQLLELVPNSAFVQFDYIGSDTDVDFTFTNLDFIPTSQLTYQNTSIEVSKIHLKLDDENLLYTLNQNDNGAPEHVINFYALFKVIPSQTLKTDPFYSSNSSHQFTFRGQFLTELTDASIQNSCDSWGSEMNVLIPGVSIQTQDEFVESGIIDLPFDGLDNSSTSYDCNLVPNNTHSLCNENFGIGTYLFGGFGPIHPDFIYEFRPFIRWPQSGSIQINGANPSGFEINSLYNTSAATETGFPISVNNYSLFQSSNQSLLNPFMKAWGGSIKRYSGLAISLFKDSPDALECGLPTTQVPEIDVDLPLNYFAYLHPEFYNSIYDSPYNLSNIINSTYTTTEVSTINSNQVNPNTSIEVLNNEYSDSHYTVNGIDLFDICQYLSGNSSYAQPEAVQVSDQFSYSFNFGNNSNTLPPLPPIVNSRVWALCSFVDASGQTININPSGNIDFSWGADMTNLSSLGAQQYSNSDNTQKLIYFPSPLSSLIQIKITTNQSLCLPEGTQLKIIYGMFCKDIENITLTNFFINPSSYSCQSCERITPLFQSKNIDYLSTSSISMDAETCLLNWNINLLNTPTGLTIENPTIRLVLPEGLLFQTISDGSITLTTPVALPTPSTITTTPTYSTTFNLASISGGPTADYSTILDINLIDFNWTPNGTLNLPLYFSFSSDLCHVISDKVNGTELSLYTFGSSSCENQVIDNIPIDGENSEYPVTLSQIDGLVDILTNTNINCCNTIEVDYSFLGTCPGHSNAILTINDITQNGSDGSPISIAIDCNVNVYNPSNVLLVSGATLPLIIEDLGAGTYIIEVVHPIFNGTQSQSYTFLQGVTIIDAPENCACSCEDGELPVIEIPSNIHTSTELTQHLITVGLYDPNSSNNSMPYPYINGHCIKFLSNFIVDNYFGINGCDIKVASGREIKIASGGGLGLLYSNISGCDFMWKGFVNEGEFLSSISNISDAQYGVFLNRTTGIQTYLYQTQFINNFVGLKTQELQGNHGLYTDKVNFNGGVLKLPFAGQSPIQLATSLAGIVINNEYSLYIPKSITFNNLNNGVISNDSYIESNGSNYNNIQITSQYIGSQYWLSQQSQTINSGINVGNGNGSGIFALNSKVKYLGFGITNSDPITFNNCSIGFFSNNSTIDIQKTRMNGMKQGILCINSPAQDKVTLINLNEIKFKKEGIKIIDVSPASGDITSNQLIGSNNKTVAITVYGFATGKGFNIIENIISHCRLGMLLNGTSGITAKGNHVAIPNLDNGFIVRGTDQSTFECNFLIGNQLSLNQTGLRLQDSPSNKIINNTFDKTFAGLSVIGTSTATAFSLNVFKNHNVGLDITPTGILGQFTNAGNRWLAQSYSIAGARSQAMSSPNSPTSTKFIVEYNPSLQIRPSLFPASQNCIGNFFPCLSPNLSPSIEYCPELTSGGGGTGLGGITTENKDDNSFLLASKVANDSLSFSNFNEELLYSVRKQIEKKLSSEELVLPDTGTFVTFKSELENGTEKKFNNVDGILKSEPTDSSLQIQMKSDLSLIHSVTYSLFQIDSLTQEPNANNEQLGNQREQLITQLEIIKERIRLIEQGTMENQGLKSDSAFYYNNGIVTQKEFEHYEKQINTIYLETYAKGNYSFTQEQSEIILQIATMCPSLGGSAVYKARTLNALLYDTLEYDDDLTCLQQGVLYRLAHSSSAIQASDIEVFPNPSSSQLTIKYNNVDAFPLRIDIFDALGRQTSNTILNNSPAILSSEISKLASGVYFYRITDNSNTIVKQNKLIKQ